MKSWISLLIVTLLLSVAGGGCKRKKTIRVETIEEDAASTLASVVHVADPQLRQQLLAGWYDVEQNAWRWTAGKFSVLLRPPHGASEKGAMLQLKFALPEPVIAKVKSVTITASINGVALPPETFRQTGEFTFSREVPAKNLQGDAVTVEFVLDKFLPSGSVDSRELGLVASMVGLEPK